MPPLPRILFRPDERSRTRGGRRASASLAVALALALGACGEDTGSLGPSPELVSPVGGATVDTDTPVLTITNARGFDSGDTTYTFNVVVAATGRDVGTVTVAAGPGQTAVRFPDPLVRGAMLEWSVTGRTTSGSEVTSGTATFRLPPVECQATTDPYAKSVEGFWMPAVCLAGNVLVDPRAALGPPDAGRDASGGYYGFVSLGNGGYVDVDMQGCAVDDDGPDVRVFQSVSSEPVTLYASSSATGPWVLVESRKPCGQRNPDTFSRQCDFDLADAGLEEARYLRVQDGELFPCPGGTDTEGADIDAVEILSVKP